MAFTIVGSYVAIVSIILCLLMFNDKERAKHKQWRISEKTLMTWAIVGGACGGVLGMYLFHHKTKHNKFVFGFPILAAIQIVILVKLK